MLTDTKWVKCLPDQIISLIMDGARIDILLIRGVWIFFLDLLEIRNGQVHREDG